MDLSVRTAHQLAGTPTIYLFSLVSFCRLHATIFSFHLIKMFVDYSLRAVWNVYLHVVFSFNLLDTFKTGLQEIHGDPASLSRAPTSS